MDYHGKCYEGPSCEKITSEANLDKLRAALPQELHAYTETLLAFADVKTSCFGKNLDPEFEKKIQIFSEKFAELGIKETPKV